MARVSTPAPLTPVGAALRASPFALPFAPLVGALFDDAYPDHATMDAAYRARRAELGDTDTPFRFVPPPPRKRGGPVDAASSYDGFVARERSVPTRTANVHDAFNFVVFLHFPRAKLALHARQLRAREAWIGEGASRIPGARTREQDALTVFDEGGVVLLGPPEERYEPGQLGMKVFVFGHAVLEHFAEGRGAMHAAALSLDVPLAADEAAAPFRARIDAALAEAIAAPSRFCDTGLDAAYRLEPDGVLTRLPTRVRGPS